MMYELAIIALCVAIAFLGYGVRAMGDSQRDYDKAMRKQRQDLRSRLVNRNGGSK